MRGLSELRLFEGLMPRGASEVAAECRWKCYEPHDLILDHGDQAKEVIFIISGAVRILVSSSEGRHMILDHLTDGDVFGEMSAIDGRNRSATVLATHRTEVCIMPGSVFLRLVLAEPELANRVMKMLVGRIRVLNERLAEHSFLTARQRLCTELLRLSRSRSGHEGQRIVSPPPIQEDLANLISSRREVVSREMSALVKAGLIERAKGGIILIKPDEISQRVHS